MKQTIVFAIITISLCVMTGCGTKSQELTPQSVADTQQTEVADPIVEPSKPFKYTIDTEIISEPECSQVPVCYDEEGHSSPAPTPDDSDYNYDNSESDREFYEEM